MFPEQVHGKYKNWKKCSLGLSNRIPVDPVLNCKTCSSYEGPPRGLGDLIQRFTSFTRIEKLVKKAAKKKGGCGCQGRREKLNEAIPFKQTTGEQE